jgi:hypothetical protein
MIMMMMISSMYNTFTIALLFRILNAISFWGVSNKQAAFPGLANPKTKRKF